MRSFSCSINNKLWKEWCKMTPQCISCRLQDKHYISHQVKRLLLINKAGYFMQIDLTLVSHSFEYVD